MLGGIVIHGKHNGKRYGFPTANLKLSDKKDLTTGVYAGYAWLHKKKYGAAIAITAKLKTAEINLLDYQGEDFYGQYLEFELLQKVSEMERLGSEEELIKKITEDVVKVRELLESRL